MSDSRSGSSEGIIDPKMQRAALVVATLVSFVNPFMGAATNIALPILGKDLGLNTLMFGWVQSSFLLASAVFLIPFGRLGDIVGRKKVFIIGNIVFLLSSLGCALSITAPLLIGFRVVQGIGGAMIFGTSIAILTSVFPAKERGKALGINVTAVYLGLSLGPFLGGLLTQQLGWRSIFFFNVLLTTITLVVTLRQLKGEWVGAKNERFDLIGSIVYSVSFAALLFGLPSLTKPAGIVPAIVGILGLLVFIAIESRTSNPILNVSLFKNNSIFVFSNLAALINYGATFAVTFLLSQYLQDIKGLSPQSAGTVLVSQPIVMAVLSPLAGRASDRIEPRIVASIGMAVTTVGLVMLSIVGGNTGLWFIICSLAVLGVGFALFSSPNTNAIMGAVDKKHYGVASAMVGTMRTCGMTVSMSISMILFSIFLGPIRIAEANHEAFLLSMKWAFVIFSIMCLCGVFASFARGKTALLTFLKN